MFLNFRNLKKDVYDFGEREDAPGLHKNSSGCRRAPAIDIVGTYGGSAGSGGKLVKCA
jgi:hypothetical protein